MLNGEIGPWVRGAVARLGRLLPTALVVLGLAGPAQAQTESRVLVLSVASRLQEDPSLRAELVRALLDLQLQALDLPDLPVADRRCREKHCLAALGQVAGAAFIVVAELSVSSQQATVWVHSPGNGTRKQRTSFDTSWSETLRGAAKLLLNAVRPAARPAVLAASTLLAVPTVPAVPTGQISSQRPVPTGHAQMAFRPPHPWRLGLGIGLAALGAVSLSVGIGATVKHSSTGPMQCPMGTEVDCRYDMTPLFAPAFALAGVSGVGALLSFALPESSSAKKERLP